MRAWCGEKIAVTLAALVVAGSTIIFGSGAGLENAAAKPVSTYPVEQPRNGIADETAGPGGTGAPWLPPSDSPRAEAWTYELFGPPEIHYDARSQQLRITPPDQASDEADGTVPGGPEAVTIPRVPFRLQLVGHFGDGADATGTFANINTGETFLARAGRKVPELGLTIAKFKVARQSVAIPNSMSTVESVAAAEVLDPASGEVTVLTDRAWVYVEQTTQPAEKFDPELTP